MLHIGFPAAFPRCKSIRSPVPFLNGFLGGN
jgi:hypothetical protein